MQLDLETLNSISQIKEILKKEIVVEDDLDFDLCVDEQDTPLLNIDQLKDLTRRGQSVFVKLLDPNE